MSPSLTIAAKPGILPRNPIGRKIMRKKVLCMKNCFSRAA